MSRAAIAILSTEALLHNVSVIRKYAPRSSLCAMVKANAYGHGIRSVSLRLEDYVDSFGVACIDEALALRKVGIKKPIILIEGVSEPDELLVASCENFHVVFHDPAQIDWLYSSFLPLPLTAWIKIDTGMGRLGFLPPEAEAAYEKLAAHRRVNKLVGIMSHLACADVIDHPLNVKQINCFETFTKNRFGPKSFCNSAGLFSFPIQQYDMVRPGLALYGVNPMGNNTPHQELQPVMTLQTRLIAVRIVPRGSTIGYGARYVCAEDMPIGVIAMGYGDGLSRTTQDGAPIMVRDKRCCFVGRVSMDMATIDLRNCPDARVGDTVILWGEGLPIEEVASFTSLSPYDMLTGIQPRVKFHWTMRK